MSASSALAQPGRNATVDRSPQLERSIDEPDQTEDDYNREEEEYEQRRRFYGSAGIGIDFSHGDYGEPDDTDILSVPAFLKLEYEPITAKVLVPFVLISGSEGVVVGEGGQGDGGATDTRYGLGDIIASLAYTWYPERKYVPIVDLSTKVKIPTASESDGIGTGKVDVTFQIDVTETVGLVSFFGGGGYRIKGGGLYQDVWLASAGASVRLGRRASVGLAYDYRQGSTSTAGDSHEIAPFASFRLGKRFRLGPYGVIGLSQNSPDWGGGTTFSVDF
jgi:hypothetical protein